MFIKHLRLENFRNYTAADIEWHEGVNLLLGLNAQGKSNLLEAVAYLSLTASFRSAAERELLKWGAPHFYAEGRIITESAGALCISAAYDRAKNKRWRRDQQAVTRKSELVGLFHTVIFSPEDIDLVKAGPGERRRFLNRQISQLNAEHCRQLLRYNKVLAQRNGLLRQGVGDEEVLSVWDQQLAELGAAIIRRRRQVLADLNPLAAELHHKLSGGERLALRYKTQPGLAEAEGPAEMKELLLAGLKRLRPAELKQGVTLTGPHRDDFVLEINGEPARAYASQGQQRTAALALKLAELQLAREQKGEWPVLLLDDVLSELDERRQRGLLQHIGGPIQTFITSASPALPLTAGQVWRIENGNIMKANNN